MLTTLCYIQKQNQVLMLHRTKKENDLNADKWIGVGGKFEDFESPEECLVREVKEETGLELVKYDFRGIVTFTNYHNYTEHMFLYSSNEFIGNISEECREGCLEWVDKDKIMDLNLWAGDRYFLEKLLNNDPFFMMKLSYTGEELVEVICDNAKIR